MLGLMILVLYFSCGARIEATQDGSHSGPAFKKGDKIITAGGIYGVVKEIKETTLLIEVDGNVTPASTNMVVADTSDLQQQQQK